MVDRVYAIKNLTVGELIKDIIKDEYKIMRNGHYLGAFAKVGNTYHFMDQKHNTWVCSCSDIDTGAESIEDAVAFVSY